MNILSTTWSVIKLIYAVHKVHGRGLDGDDDIMGLKQAAKACGGPIGMKFLQFLVMRTGFLTPTAQTKLASCLENCDTHDWCDTEAIYESNFGHSIYDDYHILPEDRIPIGSGSIAQVYHLTNSDLAMKVKHPGVEREVRAFAAAVEYILPFVPYRILFTEFIANINTQLEFQKEAANMMRLCEEHAENAIIPRVIVATSDVLIMTYHKGISFPDIQDKLQRFHVANDMFMFMLTSLLCNNFVHCDMHYGNWKVDCNMKLIVYDCGLAASTRQGPAALKNLVLASFDGDLEKIATAVCPDYHNKKEGRAIEKTIVRLMNTPFPHQTDRFAAFLRHVFQSGVEIDMDVVRCIQGLMIALSTITESTDHIMRTLNAPGNIFIALNRAILSRTQEYVPLCDILASWMDEDPNIEAEFFQWMYDVHGHCDVDVLLSVLLPHPCV